MEDQSFSKCYRCGKKAKDLKTHYLPHYSECVYLPPIPIKLCAECYETYSRELVDKIKNINIAMIACVVALGLMIMSALAYFFTSINQ